MVQAYLDSKTNAWSKRTAQTAGAILKRYGHLVSEKRDAKYTFWYLGDQGVSKYTQLTYTMYMRGYWKWLHGADAPYSAYIEQNKQLFKNSYTRKSVGTTFDEVHSALMRLPTSLEREACLRLLLSGQRSFEAGLYRKEGDSNEDINAPVIMGKGAKPRPNFSPIATVPTSYYRVYRYLKQNLGLSPHALRKLALTRAGDNGATPADLCEIAGWSSIETAYQYLQPKNTERLKGLLK